ncbi:MAG: acyltransferase [Eubacterium sp.]|nr:acyltransferase [Eubacterium sp.]
MMEINKSTNFRKDYSISCARFIAMCFIVGCHMMQRDDFSTDIQGAHIGWAFWFNIGVQMFLFISGYLYGKRKKIDILPFYKKSFPKILVDYYVFIVVMLIVICFSPLLDIGVSGAFKLLTFSGTVPGLDHLWFIATIMFCYLLTPIFSEIINAIDERSNCRFWIESIVLLLIVQVAIMVFFRSFSAAWINCFVIGMIYCKIEQREIVNRRLFNVIVIVLCLLIVPIQFRIDYWPHRELPSLIASLYGQFTNYGHVFLGIAAVILIRFVFKKINTKKDGHHLLDWSDKYSYDVYLVHHVFVQSAFGCVEFISNRWIALPLAVILSIICAVLLYHVSNYIRIKLTAVFRSLPN